LSKYLVLSSSGASTAASSDPESEPPAPTVPRIRRHRPKKLPPAEVRLALLGLTSNNDDDRANVVDGNHELTENEEDGVDEEEEEEEVFDLAHNDDVSEAEDYDLRPVEKIPKETPSSSHKKVRRKVLPEAQDSEDAEEEEGSSDQGDGDDVNNDDINGTERGEKSRHQNKRKKKLKQRTKILEKKRKVQARIEREAKLWLADDNSEEFCNDDRFDEFLRNPAFEISQTHPEYKEASAFLHYMKMHRSKVV
uniref:NUC153 domain-containing protein n=1 Tax=Trichobilharzia regenti TaxID=157069 RepID=A0AA85IZ36_TRIRE